PRTMSSVMWSVSRRIESRDGATRMARSFIRYSRVRVAPTEWPHACAGTTGLRRRADSRRREAAPPSRTAAFWWLHLPEQVQGVAAHRENPHATPDVDLRRFGCR